MCLDSAHHQSHYLFLSFKQLQRRSADSHRTQHVMGVLGGGGAEGGVGQHDYQQSYQGNRAAVCAGAASADAAQEDEAMLENLSLEPSNPPHTHHHLSHD